MSAVKDGQIIKGLETQLSKLEGEVTVLKSQVKTLNNELVQKLNTISSIRSKIKELGVSKELRISEHAILRYIERVLGINIKEIEETILCDKILTQHSILGKGTFIHPKGFKCITRDNTIVSITD